MEKIKEKFRRKMWDKRQTEGEAASVSSVPSSSATPADFARDVLKALFLSAVKSSKDMGRDRMIRTAYEFAGGEVHFVISSQYGPTRILANEEADLLSLLKK